MLVPNFTLLSGDTSRLFSVFDIQENYIDVTRSVLESVSKSPAASAELAPALPVWLAQLHYQQLQPTSQTNGADPAHPSYAHNERFPKDSGRQKTCQLLLPSDPDWVLLTSHGSISTSSPTSRQLLTSPRGCYKGMACFTMYCSD